MRLSYSSNEDSASGVGLERVCFQSIEVNV